MANDRFFMFPLPILAMPLLPAAIMETIVATSVMEQGIARIDTSDVEAILKSAPVPRDFDSRNSKHRAAIIGADFLNVTLGSVKHIIEMGANAQAFISDMEKRHGGSPTVRVATSLLWQARDEHNPTWRDFSTLLAINSVIGFKNSPTRITREMIQARRLGYKTPAVMKAELPTRKGGTLPLTVKELRTTLDHLERMKFITRCQGSRRAVYFSLSPNRDELRARVAQQMATQRVRLEEVRKADREAMRLQARSG